MLEKVKLIHQTEFFIIDFAAPLDRINMTIL